MLLSVVLVHNCKADVYLRCKISLLYSVLCVIRLYAVSSGAVSRDCPGYLEIKRASVCVCVCVYTQRIERDIWHLKVISSTLLQAGLTSGLDQVTQSLGLLSTRVFYRILKCFIKHRIQNGCILHWCFPFFFFTLIVIVTVLICGF